MIPPPLGHYGSVPHCQVALVQIPDEIPQDTIDCLISMIRHACPDVVRPLQNRLRHARLGAKQTTKEDFEVIQV